MKSSLPAKSKAEIFGEKLGHHLALAVLSQSELEKRAELDAGSVSEMLGGQRLPQPEQMRKILVVLGMSNPENEARQDLVTALEAARPERRPGRPRTRSTAQQQKAGSDEGRMQALRHQMARPFRVAVRMITLKELSAQGLRRIALLQRGAIFTLSILLVAVLVRGWPQSATPTLPFQAGSGTYFAATPGRGCDHGTGVWVHDHEPHLTCTASGMLLEGTHTGQTYAQEKFYLPNGASPSTRYHVEFDIGRLTPGGCAGPQYQQSDSSAYHYSASVCQDGSYQITRLSADGKHATLLSPKGAHVPQAENYHLSLTFFDGTQALTINRNVLPSVTDTQAGSSDFVSLAASNNSGGVLQAEFSNFVFERW